MDADQATDNTKKPRRSSLVLLAMTIIGGVMAITDPGNPVGAVCMEMLKGAIGGAIVGICLLVNRLGQ